MLPDPCNRAENAAAVVAEAAAAGSVVVVAVEAAAKAADLNAGKNLGVYKKALVAINFATGAFHFNPN